MGGKFSKKSTVNDTPTTPPDLNSYEAACQTDPTLRSFDAALHRRTARAINSLSAGLSLDSIRDVTQGLFEMDHDVVQVILDCKKDIWKNQELFNLVDDYFKNSLETLDFCTALTNCLKRARDSQFIVNVALRQFEEEKNNNNTGSVQSGGSGRFTRTLEELRRFKECSDPFGGEFFVVFQTIYRKQLVMLSKLQAKMSELDKKLRSMKKWRRLSNVLFVATFTTVLICSVVAAAVAAPPVLTALAAAAAVPLGSMGKWVNSLWKKYENEIKGEKEFIGAMEFGTFIVVKDLENIKLVIDRFEILIEGFVQDVEFAERDGGEAVEVEIAMEDIKNKLSEFTKAIEDLSEYADKCSRDVTRARTLVLHKMIKFPSA